MHLIPAPVWRVPVELSGCDDSVEVVDSDGTAGKEDRSFCGFALAGFEGDGGVMDEALVLGEEAGEHEFNEFEDDVRKK